MTSDRRPVTTDQGRADPPFDRQGGRGVGWESIAHSDGIPPSRDRFFGYTLVVDLILKLVAGLMAGLRGYFLIVAGIVAVPCILLLLLFLIRLIKPSRANPGGEKNS